MAFVTLTILEVVLSITLFGTSIGGYLAGLRSAAGAIGFAAQVCFATFPLLNGSCAGNQVHRVMRHSSRPRSAISCRSGAVRSYPETRQTDSPVHDSTGWVVARLINLD